jgi:hypothetical protein
LFKAIQNPLLAGQESALTMSNGEIKAIDGCQEWAFARSCAQVNPAVFEATIGIAGEADERTFIIWQKQESGANKNLKSVADSKDKVACIAKGAEFVAKKMSQLTSKDGACASIVSKREPAGDDKDLEAFENRRVGPKFRKVHSLGGSASSFQCESGFVVAVGARSTEYEGPWGSHHERIRFRKVGR